MTHVAKHRCVRAAVFCVVLALSASDQAHAQSIPGGPPMHLTATGTEQRRSLVLILHETSKPATTPVHEHTWTPKGLCKG
jgi:hypothetical protein